MGLGFKSDSRATVLLVIVSGPGNNYVSLAGARILIQYKVITSFSVLWRLRLWASRVLSIVPVSNCLICRIVDFCIRRVTPGAADKDGQCATV